MMELLLTLLIAQSVMGAFDTIYHHELTVALPVRPSARSELKVHALRSVLYALIFFGLAWFVFGGWWIALLWMIVVIEVVLTLMDFVIEDHTRVLPHSERVLHTLLAIGGGAAFTLLALQTPAWWEMPTALVAADYGWKSWFLTLAACGVMLSGIRDAVAAGALLRSRADAPLDVGAAHLRFLVAGGTGFIGTALTRRLVAAGHEVTLVARDPVRAAMQFGGAVRCIRAAAALPPAQRFDVVINLAGAPVIGAPWTQARKRVLLESRLAPTDDLLRYAERAAARPRVWIQASAIGYYGQNATNIDEEAPAPVKDFASEMCHRWEARAQTCAAFGVRYVALRFGLVMGRNGGSLPPLLMGLKLGAGAVIGTGRQFVSWIHLEDALDTIACAIRDARLSGPVNAVAPETVSYAVFMHEAGVAVHRPVWLKIPERLLRALLGEMAIMLVEGPCVLPGKLRTLHHEYRFPTLRSALTDLA
jgi:uncharacterized protein (TIGR01777 family)